MINPLRKKITFRQCTQARQCDLEHVSGADEDRRSCPQTAAENCPPRCFDPD